MAIKVLGINDEKDFCQCCGKKGLKRVVWCELEDGDIVHYGTTCASKKWLHMPEKDVKKEIEKTKAAAIEKVRAVMGKSPEYADVKAAFKGARGAGLRGKEFSNVVTPKMCAFDAACEAEIAKYPHMNIRLYDLALCYE